MYHGTEDNFNHYLPKNILKHYKLKNCFMFVKRTYNGNEMNLDIRSCDTKESEIYGDTKENSFCSKIYDKIRQSIHFFGIESGKLIFSNAKCTEIIEYDINHKNIIFKKSFQEHVNDTTYVGFPVVVDHKFVKIEFEQSK